MGIRLALSPPDIHQGWIGDELPSTTITEAWAGVGEVYGELWIQDTVMEEVDTAIEDSDTGIEQQEEFTQTMSTPKQYYELRRQAVSFKNPRLVKGDQSVSRNLISDHGLI